MTLKGKRALVTGATMPCGIGRAAALALARDGADVAVTGFSHMEGAQAVAEEIKDLGRQSMALRMDGRDHKSVRDCFAAIRTQLGPVDILVNNAAQMGRMVTIAKTSIEDWDNEVKLCLNSAFYCIKEAWEDMCAGNWGRIINLTSVAGLQGGFGQSGYSSAKAGLTGLAKSAALEGARFNITANCVLVGTANTEAYNEPIPEEIRQRLEKRIALRRPANAGEIGDAIAYVASDKAAYMTGATMNMLGGLDLFVF